MKSDLKLYDGIITYDDLSYIKHDGNFYHNVAFNAIGGLMKISFFNQKYLIDVDWSSLTDINGHFVVVVIQDLNWSEYLFEKNARTYEELVSAINEAVEFIYSKHQT